MANADFSQNKQTAPGGFDAGSYREKAKPEQAVTLTPRQQKLAALEAKLPAALSTRAAALHFILMLIPNARRCTVCGTVIDSMGVFMKQQCRRNSPAALLLFLQYL